MNSAKHARWLERFDGDRLVRHGVLLVAITHLGSFTNLLFHVVMGRTLPAAEYGRLAAMLGLYLVLTTPVLALQNTLAHFTGLLAAQAQTGAVRRLVRHWTRRTAATAAPLALLALALLPVWRTAFHLPDAGPVALVVFMVAAAYLLGVYVGALQGLQAFAWMSIAANAWALVRLAVGWILVLAVAPLAVFGLGAHLAGLLASLALAGTVTGRLLPAGNDSGAPLEHAGRYFFLSLLALLSFSILMNGDVVLVKLLFPDEADYGAYARASTVARILVFLCQPVAAALFPKVVSRGESTPAHRGTLLKALGFSTLMIAGAVALCLLFPRVPLLLLYGEAGPELVALVRRLALAMAPLGLTFMLLNFETARRRFRFVVPLAGCAVFFVGGVALFHGSLEQVILVFGLAAYGSLVVLLFHLSFCYRVPHQKRTP